MAHRALVAYERSDGRYDVHTSRWGGIDCRLARTITAVDPYAGQAVDPTPRVLARPFQDVVTMVDPARHETLYRVSVEYAIDIYLPLWLGLEHYLGDPPEGTADGLVVAVDSPAEADAFREWFRAAKATVAEAVLGGYLGPGQARSVLADAVRRRGADHEIYDRWGGETNDY